MRTILIAGAGGFIGSAIVEFLSQRGFKILLLSTSKKNPTAIHWDPLKGVRPATLPEVEIVINLAGENLSNLPWTAARMKRINDSRVLSTRLLIEALAASGVRPQLFLSASAVGFYGDTDGHAVDESAPKGRGFLSDVCSAWESESKKAETVLGCRTAMMRFGVVLGKGGGMMKKLLPIFRFGLGGKLGSGEQWFSWISIEDVKRAVGFVIDTETLAGPINFVSPYPVTNAEFTKALATAVSRPAILNVPTFMLRLLAPNFADEMLLKSIKVAPLKLQSSQFDFVFPEIKQALKSFF